MAKKISQLTQATEVKSDDVTVIVQDGETKKLPLNMMVTKQDIENKKVAGLAKLDEIETTYENDTYTPTITVKNKSSVKTGEGDGVDYSANVMDGPAKSAILKGQTLVNLAENEKAYAVGNGDPANRKLTKNSNSTKVEIVGKGVSCVVVFDNDYQLKANTKYTITFDSSTTGFEDKMEIGFHSNEGNYGVAIKSVTTNNGKNKIVLSTPSEFEIKGITIGRHSAIPVGSTIQISNMIVLEGEYTDQDIPYFTGMQSVKMPVLKTVGKNLFDGNIIGNYYVNIDGGLVAHSECYATDFIEIKPNTNFSTNNRDNEITAFYDEDKNFISWVQTKTFLSPSNARFLRTTIKPLSLLDTFQLEEGTTTTPYEPYKSNILTVNEDVTLRSNGDICDELNLLTGQLTQRIGEDGVVLSQEVVKTVDLMPSGTHPSTTPYCWKNGYIQLSSSGLLPNLEYSVVTSRAGQINQNATMIVKNDKRIFDLEILLAGGLVNTTYQALTLQNQVETGLSKVSLNSETEPDYLLYHMIMKLIEEKAYKLDDLTEKVSVFYLYEKLSDEQFETIYSALYPFVEDEIVEEPVVEELPEVVEDEVIM